MDRVSCMMEGSVTVTVGLSLDMVLFVFHRGDHSFTMMVRKESTEEGWVCEGESWVQSAWSQWSLGGELNYGAEQ